MRNFPLSEVSLTGMNEGSNLSRRGFIASAAAGSAGPTLGSGASAASRQAASRAGIVVLSVPWDSIPDAVAGLEWSGQIVIDATNDFDPVGLDGITSSEVVSQLIAGARVVKGANTLEASVLAEDPQHAGGQRVIFISGDDADAKGKVVALFEDASFAAIDLGDLATGGAMQQIHHPLSGINLIRLPESYKQA